MCNKKEEKKQIGTEKNYVVCMQLRSNLIEDIEMRKKIKFIANKIEMSLEDALEKRWKCLWKCFPEPRRHNSLNSRLK